MICILGCREEQSIFSVWLLPNNIQMHLMANPKNNKCYICIVQIGTLHNAVYEGMNGIYMLLNNSQGH